MMYLIRGIVSAHSIHQSGLRQKHSLHTLSIRLTGPPAVVQVYGMAQAHISVGYEYSDCVGIVWDKRVLPIPGFRMDISDIGGWNLDIHHMYNFHEGKPNIMSRSIKSWC